MSHMQRARVGNFAGLPRVTDRLARSLSAENTSVRSSRVLLGFDAQLRTFARVLHVRAFDGACRGAHMTIVCQLLEQAACVSPFPTLRRADGLPW